MDHKLVEPFNISVTGHRAIPDDQRLGDAVRQVLLNLVTEHAAGIRLYSPLAEGADQLVARIVPEFDTINLTVPLPMAVERYLADFSEEAGRRGFYDLLPVSTDVFRLPEPDEGQTAYLALGAFLVDKSDTVIAIWNGQFNHRKGGTGEVVKSALDSGKPIYWIYCPNLNSKAAHENASNKKIGEIELLNP